MGAEPKPTVCSVVRHPVLRTRTIVFNTKISLNTSHNVQLVLSPRTIRTMTSLTPKDRQSGGCSVKLGTYLSWLAVSILEPPFPTTASTVLAFLYVERVFWLRNHPHLPFVLTTI